MECTSVDWNAVGAVATACATFVALLFGFRDMSIRYIESRRRGLVALAIQRTEIQRLFSVFEKAESLYRVLALVDNRASDCAHKMARLAPSFQSELAGNGISDYVDMPKGLGYRLPTAINALPYVKAFASEIQGKVADLSIPATAEELKEIRSFISDALIFTTGFADDYREAMEYMNKHLVPLQMAVKKP